MYKKLTYLSPVYPFADVLSSMLGVLSTRSTLQVTAATYIKVSTCRDTPISWSPYCF